MGYRQRSGAVVVMPGQAFAQPDVVLGLGEAAILKEPDRPVVIGLGVHQEDADSSLVSWFWCVTITSVRRIGVRQTDDAQVMEDRKGAGVAVPIPKQSPNSCLGQQSPHLARTGQ